MPHSPSTIRPLSIELNASRYAEGSALIKMGNTHVLCTASIDEKVPDWLKGKGKGWVTAEYNMLPRATHTRSKREREKMSGRTHEIQRLIGRALRTMVDLKKLGERQIIVDCDVIQADGGTRTASVNGGCIALAQAVKKVAPEALIGTVSALSVGLTPEGKVAVDLDYELDSNCGVDMNFVVNDRNEFIEIQGTGERITFSREQMNALTDAALVGLNEVRKIQEQVLEQI